MNWTVFTSHTTQILENKNILQHLRTGIPDQWVLPYDIWITGMDLYEINSKQINTDAETIEKSMLDISLMDRKQNEWIRQKNKVTNIIQRMSHLNEIMLDNCQTFR